MKESNIITDYKDFNMKIKFHDDRTSERLAMNNYISLARRIIENALSIFRELTFVVRKEGVPKEIQFNNGTNPYTSDNALFDLCYDNGLMDSLNALKNMIEIILDRLRFLKDNTQLMAFASENECVYPEYEEGDDLFTRFKKLYSAIYVNQNEIFRDFEFELQFNWEKTYIIVTGDLFQNLHDLIEELEMNLYIPF